MKKINFLPLTLSILFLATGCGQQFDLSATNFSYSQYAGPGNSGQPYLPIHNLSYRDPNGNVFKSCADFQIEKDLADNPMLNKISPNGIMSEVYSLETLVSNLMFKQSQYWVLPYEGYSRISVDQEALQDSYLDGIAPKPRAATRGYHIQSSSSAHFSFARQKGVVPGSHAGARYQTLSRNTTGRRLSASIQNAPARNNAVKAQERAECFIKKDIRVKVLDSTGAVLNVADLQDYELIISKRFEKIQIITEAFIQFTSNRKINKGDSLSFVLCRGSTNPQDCSSSNADYLGTFNMKASQNSMQSQVNTVSPLYQKILTKVVPRAN